MPPGLRLQIWAAVVITAAALFLPTALSAGGATTEAEVSAPIASAGSVSTSTRAFSADDFPATAFTDWER
jgi:hypothetical protein